MIPGGSIEMLKNRVAERGICRLDQHKRSMAAE
jgi:hypothetical protein